jgi:NADP-dependent 3-hydroxy acid dehydrogenase YdfG
VFVQSDGWQSMGAYSSGQFKDHVAVITGAGSGVGRAIALELAAQGATLCLLGRRRDALRALAQEAGPVAKRILSFQVDIARDGDIHALRRHLEQGVGRLDLLIHSAGVISLGPLQAAPIEELDQQYRTNVRAPYLLTQALLPMLIQQRGQVVFINSSVGLSAKAHAGQYAATKHALKAIADSLRDEVNESGVRVLSVFLGRTATPMQEAIHTLEGRPYHPERLIQPQDIAAMVVHALSLPRSVEVTGISMRPAAKPAHYGG